MEFPDVGKHCSKPNCNKLDFLPIKCDVCSEIFCDEHYFYTNHSCSNAYQKDNQVPVCPLCNKPIPVAQGQEPDRIVGDHIDNDCQSDPAKNKRKVFINKCSVKGCKVKEVIPVLCNECSLNFCLKHRHPQDHHCQGKQAACRQKVLNAALSRQDNTNHQKSTSYTKHVRENTSEDEDLARALSLSMQEASNNVKSLTQEDLDLALARELQASEYHQSNTRSRNNSRDRCAVI
ncbi:AN1-type zinc finger protein 2A [Asbolus verrucosus]|uniref:AN1-type zinc finger protein 2A n=1 Tax=Asbolus verrucosus TaxID=1661398 RepID=A0A482WCC7_ASBVE|nr:AN1-type zinc finger protein 2A [Asbolus verrucosus]